MQTPSATMAKITLTLDNPHPARRTIGHYSIYGIIGVQTAAGERGRQSANVRAAALHPEVYCVYMCCIQ